jgi:hypothetical protein
MLYSNCLCNTKLMKIRGAFYTERIEVDLCKVLAALELFSSRHKSDVCINYVSHAQMVSIKNHTCFLTVFSTFQYPDINMCII